MSHLAHLGKCLPKHEREFPEYKWKTQLKTTTPTSQQLPKHQQHFREHMHNQYGIESYTYIYIMCTHQCTYIAGAKKAKDKPHKPNWWMHVRQIQRLLNIYASDIHKHSAQKKKCWPLCWKSRRGPRRRPSPGPRRDFQHCASARDFVIIFVIWSKERSSPSQILENYGPEKDALLLGVLHTECNYRHADWQEIEFIQKELGM